MKPTTLFCRLRDPKLLWTRSLTWSVPRRPRWLYPSCEKLWDELLRSHFPFLTEDPFRPLFPIDPSGPCMNPLSKHLAPFIWPILRTQFWQVFLLAGECGQKCRDKYFSMIYLTGDVRISRSCTRFPAKRSGITVPMIFFFDSSQVRKEKTGYAHTHGSCRVCYCCRWGSELKSGYQPWFAGGLGGFMVGSQWIYSGLQWISGGLQWDCIEFVSGCAAHFFCRPNSWLRLYRPTDRPNFPV